MIALQSVVVVAADNHQPHPSDEQHQAIDQDPAQQSPDKQELAKNNPSPLQNGEFDCHHCGHCHSPTQIEFLPNNNNLSLINIGSLSADYLFNYISKLFTPALRPPIA